MSHLGYGYTRKEVTTLATDYAVDLDLKGKDGKPLSLQWFRCFMICLSSYSSLKWFPAHQRMNQQPPVKYI
jgi:hypothetical protein